MEQSRSRRGTADLEGGMVDLVQVWQDHTGHGEATEGQGGHSDTMHGGVGL